MNKVTLIEYARMTDQNIQSAIELARQANALSTEQSNIYVDIDTVQKYMDSEINNTLKDVNGICTR